MVEIYKYLKQTGNNVLQLVAFTVTFQKSEFKKNALKPEKTALKTIEMDGVPSENIVPYKI